MSVRVNPLSIAAILVFIVLLHALAYVATSVKVCNIEDYGGVGNGIDYDTDAIQKAIDACVGGGTVILQPGKTYLSGSLILHSGAQLRLPANATLLASTRREDYGSSQEDWYLLQIKNCTGCKISGGGVIDGQSEKWVLERWPDRKVMRNWDDKTCSTPSQCRPHLVGVVNSSKVILTGVQLRDPVFWCLHIFRSKDVVVDGLKIKGDFDVPNNDGIDIDGSSDVTIRNCDIDTADDAICAKTTSPGSETSNLQVISCTLRSKSSAVKIGSESKGNFNNLRFENLVIKDSHRGLGIQIRDGGNLTGITFSNIHVETRLYNRSWWGAGEPIYVTALPRTPDQLYVGRVSGVVFEDITAVSENGVVLAGLDGSMVDDITIRNLKLSMVMTSEWPGGYRDLRPGPFGLVTTTVPALYVQYVDKLVLDGVRVEMSRQPRLSWSSALDMEPHTIRNFKVSGFEVVDNAVDIGISEEEQSAVKARGNTLARRWWRWRPFGTGERVAST